MRVYLRYRFIITNLTIELKITPSLTGDEINWVVDNNKEGKLKLLLSLQELSREHNLTPPRLTG